MSEGLDGLDSVVAKFEGFGSGLNLVGVVVERGLVG